MRELEHLYHGKPAPMSRRMLDLVLALVHALRTGEFPYPYPLRLQPWPLQSAFRLVQITDIQCQSAAPRLMSMLASKAAM